MIVKAYSLGFKEDKIFQVEVLVRVTQGFPVTVIEGISEKEAEILKEKIFVILNNIGVRKPIKNITISCIAPQEENDNYKLYLELPVILAFLICNNYKTLEQLNKYVYVGNMDRKGDLLPIDEKYFLNDKKIECIPDNIVLPYEKNHKKIEKKILNKSLIFKKNIKEVISMIE